MRRRDPAVRGSGWVALAVLLSAGALAAQEGAPVAVGARVRVRSELLNPPVLVATVRRVTPDTLVVRHQGGVADIRLPRASITRLEVSKGWPGRGQRAVVGAAAGLLAGAVVGLALDGGGCEDCSRRENRLSELAPSLVLGSLGAVAGLLTGAATARERWSPAAPAASAPDR